MSFECTFQSIKLGPGLRREAKDLDERTRPNALFLSVVAHWNGVVATEILGWFQRLRMVGGVPDHLASRETVEQPRRTALALRIALVQELTEPGEQRQRAVAIAETIARQAPLGVQATLRSARAAVEQGTAAAIARCKPTCAPSWPATTRARA